MTLIKFFVRSSFFKKVKWLNASTGTDVSRFLLSFKVWIEVRPAKAFSPMLEMRLLFKSRYWSDIGFVTFAEGMEVILLWCKDNRVSDEERDCQGGTATSWFSCSRSSWRFVSLDSFATSKVLNSLLLRSNTVVPNGIPWGIERSWRFLQITRVPEQIHCLSKAHARLFDSCPCPSVAPYKAKNIATKAFAI